MSFVFTQPTPNADAEGVFENDPWFPNVSLGEVREACLLDGTVTKARLLNAIADAVDSVNGELQAFKEMQRANGHQSLIEVPADEIGGKSKNAYRYMRAVNACVMALVAEAHREIDTTPHSEGKEGRIREKIEAKIAEHRRAMRWAISDILGIQRSTIELI